MFSHKDFLKNYKSVIFDKQKKTYRFPKYPGGSFLEISITGEHEEKYTFSVHHPLSSEHHVYKTNIPYRNMEDFENDLSRMGVVFGNTTTLKNKK